VTSNQHPFDCALSRWRALHDFTEPEQRAAYDRGIATWHWLVLLDPWASPAVCIAALYWDHPDLLPLDELPLSPEDAARVRALLLGPETADIVEDRTHLELAHARAHGLRSTRPEDIPDLRWRALR
jgi:hypothetical protein